MQVGKSLRIMSRPAVFIKFFLRINRSLLDKMGIKPGMLWSDERVIIEFLVFKEATYTFRRHLWNILLIWKSFERRSQYSNSRVLSL
jgi:hypothetical protein